MKNGILFATSLQKIKKFSGALEIFRKLHIIDGTNKQTVIDFPTAFETYVSWSPDGKKIAYSRRLEGYYEFWLVENFLPEIKAEQ